MTEKGNFRKPYQKCPICSEMVAFHEKTKHINFHLGIKENWTCTYCTKEFSKEENRRAHERTHITTKFVETVESEPMASHENAFSATSPSSNEKCLFKCLDCSKAFIYPSYLKQHSVIHTNKRPYTCLDSSCPKSFKLALLLWEHLEVTGHSKSTRTHIEEKNKNFVNEEKKIRKDTGKQSKEITKNNLETKYRLPESVKNVNLWPKVVLSNCLTQVLAKCMNE